MPLFFDPTSKIPDVTPTNPAPNQTWIEVIGLIGSTGQAMGVMGLSYTQPVADKYILNYQTTETVIKQVELK